MAANRVPTMARVRPDRLVRPPQGGHLCLKSATEIARMIREKEVSSVEVVTSFLERIDRVNPQINAVVQLADGALDRARESDAALARGETLGPLHGVPMTVQDSFDTQGVISTAGTEGRAEFIPNTDATVVSRLKAAGAILIGKTNTSEFTFGGDDNLVYGKTKNPYDLQRTPGGSSGGPAAILAACGSSFDIGADAGGGIRMPSHACGICGIKPTSGRVPLTGHILDWHGNTGTIMQPGPMARRVEDLELLLSVISGKDGIDPKVQDMPLGRASAVDLASLRVAYHTTNGDSITKETIESAATALAQVVQLVDNKPPPMAGAIVSLWLDVGIFLDGDERFRAILKEAGTTQLSPGFARNLELATSQKKTAQVAIDRALQQWQDYKTSMDVFFADYDVIVSLVFPTPAPVGEFENLNALVFDANLSGAPSAVVPGGVSEGGMPIGIQIVGKRWREDQVLAVAQFLEAAMGGWKPTGLDYRQNGNTMTVTRWGRGKTERAAEVDGIWETMDDNPHSASIAEASKSFFRHMQ